MPKEPIRFVAKAVRAAWTGVEVLVTLTLLVAAVSVLRNPPYRAAARPPSAAAVPVPKAPLSIDGIPTQGNANAPIVMVAFSDFQCPYCGKFARETLPALEQQFVSTGQVAIAFRHLPLAMHQYAQGAAEVATCAGRQGKFWPLHDLLFQHQDKLGDADVRTWASQAGVDQRALARCMADEAKASVDRDAQLARVLQVRGTPAFMIGTRDAKGSVQVVRVLSGARPIKDFQEAINSVVAQRRQS